jgi:ribosomal protein S12 methylthiotransferase accessory factor
MLREIEPFERVWRALRGRSRSADAVAAFVRFLEERLGANMFYDVTRLPVKDVGLDDLFSLAERMRAEGSILSWSKMPNFPDEPPVPLWFVRFGEGEEHRAAGSSTDDERHALTCALAEAMERYLWVHVADYLAAPTLGTTASIGARGRYLDPASVSGFSNEQRQRHPKMRLSPESEYWWIQGKSLTKGDTLWIPAQLISPVAQAQQRVREGKEPFLRRVITTGLATHPVREEALLGGALEIIERDAYMITWLNRLTTPRVDLERLCAQSASLAALVERCRRYRLRVHITRLLTDAPAYAFCATLEDETGHEPRIAVGLKAHRNPAACAEKAILEALRARRGARLRLAQPSAHPLPDTGAIGHYDRLVYWAQNDNYKKLQFLYEGPVQHFEEPWEQDTAAEHLERIVAWCRERGYEFATVALTAAKKNTTPWHIEMSVIPQMQPTHLSEALQHLGGERLASVPKLFGYKPRTPLFTEEPHPFA